MSPKRHPMLPLFLTVFIDMLGVGIAIPVLASVFLDPARSVLPAATTLGDRAILYGFLLSAYPLAQFIGAPVLGALSDHRGRKPVLILSLLGTAVGYFLFGLGIVLKSLPLLFLSRILDGFTGGNIATAFSAIADFSDPKQKAKNFGLVGAAFGLGFILGPFIGGELSSNDVIPWFTFSTPFFFTAGLSLLNAVLCGLFLPETLRQRVETALSPLAGFRNVVTAFTSPPVRTMFTVMFLLTLGFNFFTQFFQVILIERFAFTQANTGRLFAYVGIWIAITQGVLTKPVGTRFSPETIIKWTALPLALLLASLVLPRSSALFYVLLPFVAVCQGLLIPNTNAVISNLAGEDAQGEIMGINQSVQSLAQAVPPLVAGVLTGIHLELPLFCAGLLTLIGFGVFAREFRHPRRKDLVHEI